jgi:hypothetical protein
MHVDQELMNELSSVKEIIKPCETLLVADSMLGNDAVNISKEFNEKIEISGIIITRLDGDTRGGSTISMREVTVKIPNFSNLKREFQLNLLVLEKILKIWINSFLKEWLLEFLVPWTFKVFNKKHKTSYKVLI